MPFTNVFDNTFPPDTQAANLLGQDIRMLKLDLQQRMAVISGVDASKPNFAGDLQPAAWNGILFFAVDTGKIYQFNNPAWSDVTVALLGASLPRQVATFNQYFTASVPYTTIFNVVIAGIYSVALSAILSTLTGAGVVTTTYNFAWSNGTRSFGGGAGSFGAGSLQFAGDEAFVWPNIGNDIILQCGGGTAIQLKFGVTLPAGATAISYELRAVVTRLM